MKTILKEFKLVRMYMEVNIDLKMFCLAPSLFLVPQLFGAASADSNLMFLALLFTTLFAMGAEYIILKNSPSLVVE